MPKKQASFPLVPVLIILIILGGGLFYLFKPQQDTPVAPATPDRQQALHSQGSEAPRPETITDQTSADSDDPEPQLRQAPMQAVMTNPCLEAMGRLDHFFSYLDEQEYIRTYQFPQGSKEVISTLLNSLFKSTPPVNGRQPTSADMLRNATHIYRVLGAQNLNMLLKIIDNEADLMEETSAHFHEWFTISDQCLNHPYPLRPNLENLYDYAAFFLETSGGRAYLSRRQSDIRLLAFFYSVVIIHRADGQDLNKYSINLSPLLSDLITEMEETDELAGKTGYLSTLHAITDQLNDTALIR